MTIKLWSPTPANNNSSPPLGAPEGWTSDQVNNWARQSMADVRSTVEQLPWFDWGDVPTYVSATELTLPGDLSARYLAARRIRATISAGNIFGTITSGIYGALTTVIVVWDGAGALDSSLTAVAPGLDTKGLRAFAALAGSSTQTFDVKNAVSSPNAVNLGQAWATFAALAGDATQTFNAAAGAAASEVVNVAQSFVQAGATVTVGLETTYVAGTSYTNSSSKAQFHYLSLLGATGFIVSFQFYIAGSWLTVATANFSASVATSATIAIVVPPGVTWQVTALPSSWSMIT